MRTLKWLCVTALAGLLIVGCQPKVVERVVKETVVVREAVKQVQQTVVVEKLVEKQVVVTAAAPSSARPAAATPAAEAPKSAAVGPVSVSGMSALSADTTRKIIKSGQMSILVGDTDKAIDDITVAAIQNGGYLIALEITVKDDLRNARMVVGVPVDQFEQLQRQVRGVAIRVLKDTASGVDVTDEYVDTQSRLANLEATQVRIRSFLDQARTVEEALKVNEQLRQIEAEIDKTKGRLNFLQDRSAYSTLSIDIAPDRPTPTPTATATVTPTPTPTATPTPWKPGQTAKAASGALGSTLRVLTEVVIWLLIYVVPLLSPIIIIIIVAVWRHRRRPRVAPPTPSAPPTASSGSAGQPPSSAT